jgi:RNA 3'-terminal phosphate cyclase (ATP)
VAEYLESIFIPMLMRAGILAEATYPSAGYFPKGGGELDMTVTPASSIQPLNLTERGEICSLRAYVVTSNLPGSVGERGASTIREFMRGRGITINIEFRDKPSKQPGAAVMIAAECENGFGGFSALGERGKPMERVAEDACQAFLAWWDSGAACDEHLADQMVLPMALAPGESRWTTPIMTEHLRTVIWVTQHFLPIEVDMPEHPGKPHMVILRGAA